MTAQGNPFDSFARLYDWEHDLYNEDLPAYLALAQRFGGPTLELACGSGRVLEALAQAGVPCTGVDSSPAMLERAHQRLAPFHDVVTLIKQDLVRLHLSDAFRTILFPLDGLGLLDTIGQQQAALRAVRACATHDARLVVDVANGNLRGANEPSEEIIHHLTAPDITTGEEITKWVIRRPDWANQIDNLSFLFDESLPQEGCFRRTIVDLRLRWFGRFELELLLASCGWDAEELYGDYDFSAYDGGSPRLLMVARAGRVTTITS